MFDSLSEECFDSDRLRKNSGEQSKSSQLFLMFIAKGDWYKKGNKRVLIFLEGREERQTKDNQHSQSKGKNKTLNRVSKGKNKRQKQENLGLSLA